MVNAIITIRAALDRTDKFCMDFDVTGKMLEAVGTKEMYDQYATTNVMEAEDDTDEDALDFLEMMQ